MITRSAAVGLGALVLTALAACQVIAGIERVEKVDGTDTPTTTSSSSSSGGSSSGVSPDDPCKHVLPPEPPKSADQAPDLPPFYVAATGLRLTDDRGYDLDLSCTCDPRPGTNQDGGAACVPRAGSAPKSECDPDGGVDNRSSGLFKLLAAYGENLDDGFQKDAEKGKRTILILIKNWNGQPNDFDVTVGIFVSNGAQPVDENGKGTPPDPPIESGKSDWSHPSTVTKQAGTFQPTALPNGYVSNGTLVVKNAGTVAIFLGNNGLTFNEALVAGQLKRDPATGITEFNGVVGGRIRASELLAAAGQLKVGGEVPACTYNTPPFTFDVLKSQICLSTDIAEGSRSDFKGLTCDSISSAISLTAYTATVSGDTAVDIPAETNPNPCAPDQVGDPSIYQCP